MVEYCVATGEDMELLMSSRLEMLRVVNGLPEDGEFDNQLVQESRVHLMNVYTRESHRRQGIAARMVEMLVQEARGRGVTEISLDATESGRPLYEKMGFAASEECMVLNLDKG